MRPGHDFLVKRVLLPAASDGKWFEYTKFASWEGRFVADSRPVVAVDAHDEHFQIIDLYGIEQLEAYLKVWTMDIWKRTLPSHSYRPL